MKKVMCVLMCIGMIGLAVGCGNAGGTGSRSSNQSPGVEDVLQAGINKVENAAANSAYEGAIQEPENGDSAEKMNSAVAGTIDVDLTKLSSTMVYSEVFNMMNTPDDYIGKTVKMDGQFTTYHDDSTGNNYYACIIQDAAACCSQGMEFVLTDDYAYPADYPQDGEMIAVVGVFDTYMEGDYKYCTLRNAVLTN